MDMHFHSKSVVLCLSILALLSHGVPTEGLYHSLIRNGDYTEHGKTFGSMYHLKTKVKKSGGLMDVLFNMPDLLQIGKRSKKGDQQKYIRKGQQEQENTAYFIRGKSTTDDGHTRP